MAADQGNTSIVSLLIAAGQLSATTLLTAFDNYFLHPPIQAVKVTVRSAEGETPLQMAERRKHKEVAKLLREAMHRTAIADSEGNRVVTLVYVCTFIVVFAV